MADTERDSSSGEEDEEVKEDTTESNSTERTKRAEPEENDDTADQNVLKKSKTDFMPAAFRAAKIIPDVQVEVKKGVFGLADEIVDTLVHKFQLTHFFPVQAEIIPVLMKPGGDLCACAPTGSGKTLAYAVPIIQIACHHMAHISGVQALRTRLVRRLRALVLVPTRELALQVYSVMLPLAEPFKLTVEVVIGQTSFKAEQAKLRQETDILVATPGRLTDHINGTSGFTLQHLKYLVIDEADRLVEQSYQEWLPTVLAAAKPVQGQVAIVDGDLRLCVGSGQWGGDLRKVLVSATMSTNPSKLASLHLNNPSFYTQALHAKYRLPQTLEEYVVVCTRAEKPLVMLHLMAQNPGPTLCFTASIDSTHRLYKLLELYGGVSVAEYSSDLPQHKRNEIMLSFKKGTTRLIVCSDVMSRGLDITGVAVVINYDVAPFIKTYVHRVGRTARAGKCGKTFTLARREDEALGELKTVLEEEQKHKKATTNNNGESALSSALFSSALSNFLRPPAVTQ